MMRKLLVQVFLVFLVVSFAPIAPVYAQASTITVTTLKAANLRAGPGTTYAVVGSVKVGVVVTITGRNAAGDWYQLADGKWIAAFLVSKPSSVPPLASLIPAGAVEATVTGMTDGDTIQVKIGGTVYDLRYIGINTPETSNAGGAEATAANRQLVNGQKVYLVKDVSDVDPFGRLLRYVYLSDGRLVNAVLAEQGWAYAIAYPPDTKMQTQLVAAQRRAETAKVGLWKVAASAAAGGGSSSGGSGGGAAAGGGQGAAPAQPTVAVVPSGGDLQIIKVDKRDEYVVIQNAGNAAVNLGGWKLLSVRGSQECSLGGEIGAGATLKIWAMSGSGGFSCGFGSNIWNNSEDDDAVLIDASGANVDVFDS